MSNWKTKLVSFALLFKIVSAVIGAVSYCWQMNLSSWLLLERQRSAFSWNLFLYFPTPAVVIGGLMGYISAVIFVLWCQQYYRTAHFIASTASSWCIGLGIVFIGFLLVISNESITNTLSETIKMLLVFGMPFFWGLILQVCARRLKHLPWRIET